ncbi:MAG: type I-F CRISPR-associated endoribonuclease Cas6/Csy4 [Candidatus Thiodiazotropha sp. (ex Lucinoma kastoroae)]|nr:type I-F CRISPR-associated endoribonuclease Cas6/Csy4 [Candidatus Thiodiazotropha sp. (ex Lucinoma kastoroae)]
MDHFQDLKILPDPEFSTPMLMNALFAKLHRSFVKIDNRSIGISFPGADQDEPSLGNTLRLHGDSMDLLRLQEEDWQSGMRDHMKMKTIAPVPDDCQFCRVKRVQVKSSADRLRRRYAKRHQDVSADQIGSLFPDALEKKLQLPYLRLKSASTGQCFMLFISHDMPKNQMVSGDFNCYGLSEAATIPWF